MPSRSRRALVVLLLALTACSGHDDTSPGADDTVAEAVPELGSCRMLTPEDVALPSNADPVVDCAEEHTAETFAIGTFPDEVLKEVSGYDDRRLGRHVYSVCNKRFQGFLGTDESAVMRSMLTWAWFRPSEAAWKQGARWYRCDVIGGGEQSRELVPLPQTVKGLLLGVPDDEWMVCAQGPTVAGSVKVPCSESHEWRAVTTIKLGRPGDDYPGDRVAEVRTRDFCSDSVGAWLNYPTDYEFGYTWFHEQEWEAGNRRSVCWARTDQ